LAPAIGAAMNGRLNCQASAICAMLLPRAPRKTPAERPQSAGEFTRLFQMAVERMSEAEQRWNPPHCERPTVVLKPVKSGSGILSELNEQPTQFRRPEALAAQIVERAALPSGQTSARWLHPLLIALGASAFWRYRLQRCSSSC
jgi:hypothetical protein